MTKIYSGLLKMSTFLAQLWSSYLWPTYFQQSNRKSGHGQVDLVGPVDVVFSSCHHSMMTNWYQPPTLQEYDTKDGLPVLIS